MQALDGSSPAPAKRPLALMEGSIASQVWALAWPAMLTFLLQTINGFLDRIFVGKLGTNALAGVHAGGQLMFLVTTVAMAISIGTTALVARMTGAGDPVGLKKAARQSLGLALVLGTIVFALAWVGLPVVLNWYGLKQGANLLAHQFLSTAMFGIAALFVLFVLSGTFRGWGDTRSPLYAMVIANLVHIGGDWVLIFGHYGFPRLGILGAGIAFGASIWVGALVLWLLMLRSPLKGAAMPEIPIRDWAIRILRIGVPASFRNMIYVTSAAVYTGLLAATREGTDAVAALPIGMTAESIAFMPGFAFGIAASALVGQSLGAKDEHRAERSAWAAAWQACAVMSTMAIVFYVFAEHFARWFTQDPRVIALAVAYLRINAFTEPLLAFGMVLGGALQGAGDTMKPALASLFTQGIVRLPLTYLLAIWLALGANSAWWAMAISSACNGLVMIWLFNQGSWKKVKV